MASASGAASRFTFADEAKLTATIRRKVLIAVGKFKEGKKKRRRRRGRLPTSREALKLTGELEDGWHLYKAVTGSVAANQHVPRTSRAAGTPCFYNLSSQL